MGLNRKYVNKKMTRDQIFTDEMSGVFQFKPDQSRVLWHQSGFQNVFGSLCVCYETGDASELLVSIHGNRKERSFVVPIRNARTITLNNFSRVKVSCLLKDVVHPLTGRFTLITHYSHPKGILL
ncbi:hypothetical protein IC620_12995 [Hazenella sp. IB182357]|uniref:Endospore appendages core domain-containing protein n=1 Tax=Polycladospora coralii TaxID=2771432 RepID=A0A926NAH0_9BACL|nr:S-Ena type endospore appendage [Polycladospora coralii]MBD1373266.1 hypothetical protein [Polycladospora coralii]MBS7528879.1 hypothetical protein [Polycladospora coralii]